MHAYNPSAQKAEGRGLVKFSFSYKANLSQKSQKISSSFYFLALILLNCIWIKTLPIYYLFSSQKAPLNSSTDLNSDNFQMFTVICDSF